MALVKLLNVGGAYYTMRNPPHTIAGVPFWGATVTVKGIDTPVYSHLKEGPFSFKVPASLQDKNPTTAQRQFVLMRHGATALNKESGGPDRIRGWTDLPLSGVGEGEVAQLGKDMANSGLEHIYSSDLIRAQQTANAVVATTNASFSADPGLRPWNVGVFTGQESKVAVPQMYTYAEDKPDEQIPGGESFNAFSKRVFDAFQRIFREGADRYIGIVTHYRCERLLKAWAANGQKPDRSISFDVLNKMGEHTATSEVLTIDLNNLYAVDTQ